MHALKTFASVAKREMYQKCIQQVSTTNRKNRKKMKKRLVNDARGTHQTDWIQEFMDGKAPNSFSSFHSSCALWAPHVSNIRLFGTFAPISPLEKRHLLPFMTWKKNCGRRNRTSVNTPIYSNLKKKCDDRVASLLLSFGIECSNFTKCEKKNFNCLLISIHTPTYSIRIVYSYIIYINQCTIQLLKC